MSTPAATALIAEDEPLLAQALRDELSAVWPELKIVDQVGDGAGALASAMRWRPDVLFFDIRMPGMSGLEAAAALADEWITRGPQAAPFPVLVFVTAYDQYALQAFETQALDYVIKPVQPQRLQRTVLKVQAMLQQRTRSQDAELRLEHTLTQLRGLLGLDGLLPGPEQTPASASSLEVIQASVTGAAGTSIRLVPVDEVVYFEAADKYVRVLTDRQELLIRTPLKELLAQLDARKFWQVHRGTVVRASAIDSVLRDDVGRLSLRLRSRSERLSVSRLYAHRFRAM